MRGTVRWGALASLLTLSGVLPIAAQASVNHSAWDAFLKRYVTEGHVDYAAIHDGLMMDQERKDQVWNGPAPPWALLAVYLDVLERTDSAQLHSTQEQLAFWINAYNANVVKGVLDHYPIASVKEVKGFFDRIRYRVAGRELTLNEIEGEGRALGDWRIHFAVVCASSSCPLLRAEAYAADRLDAQLAEQTREFLADKQRGLRIEEDVLWASKIFKWYAKDFLPSKPLTAANLLRVLAPYAIPMMKQPPGWRYPNPSQLKFLDYDWSLNVQRR